MPRPHYYNDHDPQVCAWLRALIAGGHLPEGDVDERSITDVDVRDLAGYVACHFFAGIGGWPLALRIAGWPDDRPVWTGSPPCQPFSAAGQRRAAADERHLAPAFLKLVWAARPAVLFGEQVASSAVVGKVAGRAKRGAADPREWAWLDDLSDGLEAAGYAVGAADLPAAGVGAPHIRQRLFFAAVRIDQPALAAGAGRRAVGVADGVRNRARAGVRASAPQEDASPAWRGLGAQLGDDSPDRRMAQPVGAGLEGQPRHGDGGAEPGRERAGPNGPTAAQSDAGRLGDADDERHRGRGKPGGGEDLGKPGAQPAGADADRARRPGAADDPWRDADWLWCRDGKWRPVRPGSFPLAVGVPARVVRLRGYGNAIVPQVAAQFVRAFTAAAEIDGV